MASPRVRRVRPTVNPQVLKNKRAEGWLRVAEGSLFTPIFLMIGKILPEVVKVGFFPAAGLFSLIGAFLVTREAKLKKWRDKGANFRAFLELLTMAAIITGIVFSFVAATLAAPIIFTAALGVKALYNLGASIYYAVKACTSGEPKSSEYLKLAGQNLVGFLVNSAITASVGFALIAGQPLWWLLGMGGAIAGAAFTAGTLLSSGNESIKDGRLIKDSGSPDWSLVGHHSDSDEDETLVNEASPILRVGSRPRGQSDDSLPPLLTRPSTPTTAAAVSASLQGVGQQRSARQGAPVVTSKNKKREEAATTDLPRSDSGPLADTVASARQTASAGVSIPAANATVTGTGLGLHSRSPRAAVLDGDKEQERDQAVLPGSLSPYSRQAIYG